MKDLDQSDATTAGRAERYRYSVSLISGVAQALDVAAIVLSGLVCHIMLVRYSQYTVEYYIFAVVFVAFAMHVLCRRADLYEIGAIMRPIGRSDYLLAATVTAFLFFLTIAFSLKASEVYSRVWIYGFGASSFFAICLFRILLYRALKLLSRRQIVGRSLAVLGAGEQGRRFIERLEAVKPYFTTIHGVYDRDPALECEKFCGYAMRGGLDELVKAARRAEIDDIVVALPWNADKDVIEAVETLKQLPVNVFISSDLVGFQLAFRPALGTFQELPMFEVVTRPISGWGYLMKMAEDYILASIALLLLSPLLLIVAAAIKLESKGPVFFRQPRLGFNNQRFEIYKFRSMYLHDEDETRVKQAEKDDPRITRVGRIIRRTSIDELPQLLNVLDGTMSLVGPRPHALTHNQEFAREVRGYFARHKVKPGITGWAQANGYRGETDTPEKIRLRVQHDVYYAENWSLMFDLRILVMTVLVVLFQKSAY
ncbi:MAG: undecaprenyl-phosphate glucose phosphotransferase [Pseudomonadota bacterium]